MSGGSRNQIELTDELARFFDPFSRAAEKCTIRLPNGTSAEGRPAKHRGHSYGQWEDIWRIGLPTSRKGGPKYPGGVIRLDKVKTQKGFIYEMTVTSPGSSVFKQWRAEAKSKGKSSSTGGTNGRLFGYY